MSSFLERVCFFGADELIFKLIFGGIFMVFEKVAELLSKQFDVEQSTITMDTSIQDDLGADSLDIFDLLMSLEDEFDAEIPDEEIENMKTVGAVVKFIEENQ